MSIERLLASKHTSLYERDFLLWLQEQQKALQSGDTKRLDFSNLAEEIGDLGKNLKREVSSRLETLIVHLIKLSVSEAPNPRAGWKSTVREQRRQLQKLFQDSPSLKRYADDVYHSSLLAAKSEAYFALKDYEPEFSDIFEDKIKAGWDVVDIELVLLDGNFIDISENKADRKEK